MAKRVRKSKVRRTHRKGTRRATRRMRGGYANNLNPSTISNTSMEAPYKLNMLQGQEYLAQHANQRGGFQNTPPMNSPSMNSPSMNSPSMNSPSMNSPTNSNFTNIPSTNTPSMNVTRMNTQMNTQMGGMAPVGETGVLDSSLRDSARIGPIDQAFQEIAGMKDQAGGRRRRKGRKTRKSRKGSKSRRNYRKSRRMLYGGSALMPASTDANPMLLEGSSSSQAVAEMNPEWKLAENPNSFSPMK